MDPADALNLVDQAVAQVNATRQVHVQLQQAIESLRKLVNGIKQPEEDDNGRS